MKKLLICLLAVCCLAGCGGGNEGGNTGNDTPNNNETTGNTQTNETYAFESNGVAIALEEKADPILTSLGEPLDRFEAKSCAFNGWDKIYYYPGFELHTSLPEGEEETVASIVFTDDTVTTKEGIYIGSTLDNIKTAYGEDFTETDGQISYVKGNTKLSFIITDDAAISISYAKVEQ